MERDVFSLIVFKQFDIFSLADMRGTPLFQSLEPMTEKALSPTILLVMGTFVPLLAIRMDYLQILIWKTSLISIVIFIIFFSLFVFRQMNLANAMAGRTPTLHQLKLSSSA